MMIRIGIPASFRRFSAVANNLGAPILISANALRRNGRFRHPKADLFNGANAALDSAGFVAMMRYGGFPWQVEEYVALAGSYPWAWWAAMDYCCEPQIAGDREEVDRRLCATVAMLRRCEMSARERNIIAPMPVLQGWQPDDYLRCADLIGDLPDLVGVGSVCRRQVFGSDGLIAVINRLDRGLPAHVRVHLFGVKGAAIAKLRGHPRVASVDSMAWDFACRRDRGDAPYSTETRSAFMRRWYLAQVKRAEIHEFGQMRLAV